MTAIFLLTVVLVFQVVVNIYLPLRRGGTFAAIGRCRRNDRPGLFWTLAGFQVVLAVVLAVILAKFVADAISGTN